MFTAELMKRQDVRCEEEESYLLPLREIQAEEEVVVIHSSAIRRDVLHSWRYLQWTVNEEDLRFQVLDHKLKLLPREVMSGQRIHLIPIRD